MNVRLKLPWGLKGEVHSEGNGCESVQVKSLWGVKGSAHQRPEDPEKDSEGVDVDFPFAIKRKNKEEGSA